MTKYDLSQTNGMFISFINECCSNYQCFNLNELDLSNTNLNLDLNYFTLRTLNNKRPKINCNGCKVYFDTNFSSLRKSYSLFEINEELFDENTRKNNHKVFLSNNFTPEFKKKFYNREIDVQDLLDLSEEQLLELNQNHFFLQSKLLFSYYFSSDKYCFAFSTKSTFAFSAYFFIFSISSRISLSCIIPPISNINLYIKIVGYIPTIF